MRMSLLSNQTNSLDPLAVHSRIFVGNLNTFQCSKSDVEKIFQRYGRIAGISMHKGYAFIQFTNPHDARQACEGEDGSLVLNQNLDVNLVTEPKVPKIAKFVNKLRKRKSSAAINKIDTCEKTDSFGMTMTSQKPRCHQYYYYLQQQSPPFHCTPAAGSGGFGYDHQTVSPVPSLSPSAAGYVPQTLWYANCFLNGQYYGNEYQMLGPNVDDVSRNQPTTTTALDEDAVSAAGTEVEAGDKGEENDAEDEEDFQQIGLFDKHKQPCSEKEFLAELKAHSSGVSDVLICGNCKELFADLEHLIEHRRLQCKLRLTCKCQYFSQRHNSNFPITKLLCSVCRTEFEDSWDLIQHVQTTHQMQIFSVEDGYMEPETRPMLHITHQLDNENNPGENTTH